MHTQLLPNRSQETEHCSANRGARTRHGEAGKQIALAELERGTVAAAAAGGGEIIAHFQRTT